MCLVHAEEAQSKAATHRGEDAPFPFHGRLSAQPFSYLLDDLQELAADSAESSGIAALRKHIKFQEMLCFLFAQNGQDSQRSDSQLAVERTITFLQQRFQEKVAVEELAEQAQIGLWQYRKLLKKITGQNPHDYITELRMNRAKGLLLVSKDRIADIALRVGYQDECYFNRRFKQTVGVTPRQYAKGRLKQLNVMALSHLGDLFALGTRPLAAQSDVLGWLGAEHGAGIAGVGLLPEELERAAALPIDLIIANRYTDPVPLVYRCR